MSIFVMQDEIISCAERRDSTVESRLNQIIRVAFMKIAIMQPYFFPYLGYWQLINAVDKFVVYDNIKYTKKGWINRNRFLLNDKVMYFTVPLKKGSDYLNVNERVLSDSYKNERLKLLRKIECAYRKSPFYAETIELFKECLFFNDKNLFAFILYSLRKTCEHLHIPTTIEIASNLNYDTSLKSQDKVIDICLLCGADSYINPVGGKELYDKRVFKKKGIELKFIKPNIANYFQNSSIFIPNLSIVDVLMFNAIDKVNEMICDYELE